MNALTICLLAAIVAFASAQSGPFCHTCELMINDVKANHPEGFANVSQQQLETEMFAECHKNAASVEAVCDQIIKNNEAALLDALRKNTPTLDCCKAVNLC